MQSPSVLGIVSYKVFPAQMGGQQCAAGFYQHLSQLTSVVLTVYKGNTAPAEIRETVLPFLYHHRMGFANLRYVFRLRKMIKTIPVDVVIIEHSYLGWMGVLLRKLTHKPFVIRSHNIEAKRFRDMQLPWWRIYQWYEGMVHRKADHNFFVTTEDMDWAISHWKIQPAKCTIVPCGTELHEAPSFSGREDCRKRLITENKLDPETKLFLFNGTLDYLPNTDALRIIISELLPLLRKQKMSFKILICGSRAGKQWEEVLRSYPEIIYKGFTGDISIYLKGCDCLINPVTLGSGIKVKLVNAIAEGLTCISTKSGAKGIPQEVAGDQLIQVNDYDWPAFVQQMIQHNRRDQQPTPGAFYQMFHWDNIVQKALLSLQTV